jgi:hypothetical protein
VWASASTVPTSSRGMGAALRSARYSGLGTTSPPTVRVSTPNSTGIVRSALSPGTEWSQYGSRHSSSPVSRRIVASNHAR